MVSLAVSNSASPSVSVNYAEGGLGHRVTIVLQAQAPPLNQVYLDLSFKKPRAAELRSYARAPVIFKSPTTITGHLHDTGILRINVPSTRLSQTSPLNRNQGPAALAQLWRHGRGNAATQMHAQILMNLLDFGMNLQEAGDAPRIVHIGSSQPTGEVMTDGGAPFVSKWAGFPEEVREELARRGHQLSDQTGVFGG